jgi:hypothetical protein
MSIRLSWEHLKNNIKNIFKHQCQSSWDCGENQNQDANKKFKSL